MTVLEIKWSQKSPPCTGAPPSQPLSNNVTPPKRSTATFAHSPTRLHHSASVQTPLTARCPPPYRQRSKTDGGVVGWRPLVGRNVTKWPTVELGLSQTEALIQTLDVLLLNADDPFLLLFFICFLYGRALKQPPTVQPFWGHFLTW